MYKPQVNSERSLHDGGLNLFGFYGLSRQTFSPIIGDCFIDDRSTIDALPGIEDQKEIREAIQLHKSFAFWTLHLSLLNSM